MSKTLINQIQVNEPEVLTQNNSNMENQVKTIADLEQEIEEKKKQLNQEREKQRKAYEELRNSTVENLCKTAQNVHTILKDFKAKAFQDTQAVYELLQEYSNRHKDGKGNFTIEHGMYRLSYKRQGKPSFDERSHQAEKHIIDFVNSKFQDDKDTKEMIMALLERKQGALDINLIQKLYQFEDRFDDENWKKGISLLKESYSYNHSKDYINFEQRDEHGEWKQIILQFSNV